VRRFNSLDGICKWAADLGFKGILPTLDTRFIDLQKRQTRLMLMN
jgi:hypothetical protein